MYFVFDRKPLLQGRWIDDGPFVDDVDFDIGKFIQPDMVDGPLEYTLKKINPNSEDHGPYKPAYLRDAYPLFRLDLIDAMKKCGVDNIQAFDVIVMDPETGTAIDDYKAVNIVGLISAANMEESIATVHQNPPLIDVEFDELVIDEDKAKGALLFRLAESTGTIIVHKNVRDCLIEQGFDKDLAFFDPGEVAT